MELKIDAIVRLLDERFSTGPQGQLNFILDTGSYLSAIVRLGRIARAIEVGDWLISEQQPNGKWIAYQEWDAFADGTINPADTCYGIDLAFATHGLLDLFNATGMHRFRQAAVAALGYYSQYFVANGQGGFWWFSDQLADVRFVSNTSALLMGACQRTGDGHLTTLAAKAWTALDAWKVVQGERIWWPYKQGAKQENDLAHAAQTALGIVAFGKDAGQNIPSDMMARRIADHNSSGMLKDYASGAGPDRPASLRGIGLAIHALVELRQYHLASEFVSGLSSYEVAGDLYGPLPGQREQQVRGLAFVVLGLAHYQAATQIR
jgi:hypothetical protein